MQMMPMVAAVPNAVPRSMDIMVQSKNVARMKIDGEISEAEMLTISGIVPAARHAALIAPTTANSAMIVLLPRRTQKLLKEAFLQEFLGESITKKEEETNGQNRCKRKR